MLHVYFTSTFPQTLEVHDLAIKYSKEINGETQGRRQGQRGDQSYGLKLFLVLTVRARSRWRAWGVGSCRAGWGWGRRNPRRLLRQQTLRPSATEAASLCPRGRCCSCFPSLTQVPRHHRRKGQARRCRREEQACRCRREEQAHHRRCREEAALRRALRLPSPAPTEKKQVRPPPPPQGMRRPPPGAIRFGGDARNRVVTCLFAY